MKHFEITYTLGKKRLVTVIAASTSNDAVKRFFDDVGPAAKIVKIHWLRGVLDGV